MPVRLIRDGILSSEKVCSLTFAAEVFYRRLMSVVDDFGRYTADNKLLRAALYPLQLDEGDNPEYVRRTDIERWLQDCVRAGLLRMYSVSDGKHYIELLNFNQQLRASKSKYPDPIDDSSIREHPLAIDNRCKHPIAPSHLDGDGDGDVCETTSIDVVPARDEKIQEKCVDDPPIKAKRRASPEPECPDGVSEQTWQDWRALRTRKRAPITVTVMTAIAGEAKAAGLSLDDALKTACTQGWQTFRASWYRNLERGENSTIGRVGTRAEKFDPVAFVNQKKGAENGVDRAEKFTDAVVVG